MSKTKRPMLDPSVAVMEPKLTMQELSFLEENRADHSFTAAGALDELESQRSKKPKKARPRTLSMSDDFFDSLTDFVGQFPEEGSRSALIVRVVTEYMNSKKRNLT